MGLRKAAWAALLGTLGSVSAARGHTSSRPPAVSLQQRCHKPAPALFWGSALVPSLRSTDSSKRSQSHDAHDIASFAVSAELNTEAVVVLLSADEAYSTASLAASAASLRRQQKQCHMASADAVLPYVYPASRSLSELLPEAAAAADVTVIRTTSTLLSSVLQDSAIFSNGKTDLILVTIDPSEDLDGVVGSTKGLLEERDTHAYVLLVASDAGGEGCGRRRLVAESISVRRAQEIVTVRTIKMTPCILAGLLFFFFFLFLLWVGLGCLGAISYPKEFIHPEQQPALGREY